MLQAIGLRLLLMRSIVKKESNLKNTVIKILWVIAGLVSIKSIFVDFGADSAYTIAMSYRHLSGDRMFFEMWEPHQTSIFFTDVFMWIYHLIIPSYEGVAVYLNVIGTLFFAVIAHFLFKEIKRISDSTTAHFSCIFFLIFRAKQTVFPEFANLQIACSVLCFLLLLKFLGDESKIQYLIISGMFLCLQVLSYPSCVISYLAVLLSILIFSNKKARNSLIVTGVCALIGLLYASYFILRMGLGRFLETLSLIVTSDSHETITTSGFAYFKGFLLGCCWIGVSLLCALIIYLIIVKAMRKKSSFLALFSGFLFLFEVIMLFIQKKVGIEWTCIFYIIPVLLICIGFLGFRKATEAEKKIFIIGLLLSMASMFAAMMLTDLGIITVVAFLVLGGTVSFAMMRHVSKDIYVLCVFILATVLFHRGAVIWGFGNNGHNWMLYEAENYIRSGPSRFIVSDYMTYYETEKNIEDFNKYIDESDTVLFTDDWLIDPSIFVYSPGKIANYSVIDTPIYNESMLEYFKMYPEKTPTVVAVDCWYGNLNMDPESFLMKWVEENYEKVADGCYFRFYRKKAQ